ncbi:MAG: AEC family transporter [Betaproteobacteria bacterium]
MLPSLSMFTGVVALTAPLFLLVLVGYVLVRWGDWPKVASDALTRFVFAVAIPALLFRLMSEFPQLPTVDARLLLAYFGGCAITYIVARVVAGRMFAMDGAQQSLFGMGTIFANNVLLGIPLAKVTLGDDSLPVVSLILIFNSLLLWTLVTISVEWARNRDLSLRGIGRTAHGVVTNPVVAGILLGTAFGFSGLTLPAPIDQTLQLVGQAAVPMSLIVLGMGLSQYGVRDGWRPSIVITAMKLVLMPLVVFALARALDLPLRELRAVVLLASLPIGANVYLMARQFKTMEGPVAASMVWSTLLAAFTTPLLLTFLP